MRIAVVGAGAIGGFIAAMLARAGMKPAVVARGAHLAALQRNGLRVVSSDAGAFEVQVNAVADLRETETPDIVLLAVKAHQLSDAIIQIQPALASGTHVVTLQNGIPFWYFGDRAVHAVDRHGELRNAIPQEQIIGCVVHVSGHIAEPGVIAQSGGMRYIFGRPDGHVDACLRALVDIFKNAELQPEISEHIRGDIWRKLLGNASLNPVSALTRLTIRPMVEDAQVRALLLAVMEEVIAVAQAHGVEVGLDPKDRLQYAARLSNVKTSMLQDVEARRAVELDPIVGALIELAEQKDVNVPLSRAIYALTNALQHSYLSC